MADAETEEAAAGSYRPSEDEKVRSWRLACLLEMGFDQDEAELAAAEGVDVHEVAKLLDAGCPPKTALRILF